MQQDPAPAEHGGHGTDSFAGSQDSHGVQKVHGKPHHHHHHHGHHHHHHHKEDGTLEISPDMIEEIRSHLTEEFRGVDDQLVSMFIRATNANMALSAKRLQTTLEWRRDHRAAEIVCTACQAAPRSHYMHVVGYDLLQRPIIYSCNNLASNRDFQDNWNHMIQSFEMAIKCMPPGVEQWIWILDFHGFSMADVNPKLAKAFLDVAGEHYPERLGYFLVLDAPTVFSMLWRAIEVFIDRKTHKKIAWKSCDLHLPGDKSKLRAELAKHADDETRGWLEQEILHNRDKAKVAANKYDYAVIHEQCKGGAPPPAVAGEHNCHGTPQLLSWFAEHPESLQPQATSHKAAAAGASGAAAATGAQ
eukprot:CAMPEP_0202863814 /NCGR_PEP_ID=MMETSP1391-20130828/4301_1 /ASSEMBLY_ACC=CAM_ASM_000867 /TAXON_ID=1034604 /ORGANISM="Chlamydomonas leiostraca, Strain SAG 11-49" /LENGTH=358 /DNA_ID=CAMNT_0049543487 /DNA_START=136 /DNA_END=1212 /DNA_ORIENTATION=+